MDYRPQNAIIPVSKSKTYPTIKDLLPLKEKFDKMMMDAIRENS